jgi:hypothetical protein
MSARLIFWLLGPALAWLLVGLVVVAIVDVAL